MKRSHQSAGVESDVQSNVAIAMGRRIGPFDGVDFDLSKRDDGVFMRRSSRDTQRALVEHFILFSTFGELTAWLDEDPVVRARPFLQDQLKRLARELFEPHI